jgi:hypothetical protein
MTIEPKVKIELKCKRADCPNTFLFDSELYPPRMYCSPACANLHRVRKYRRKQAEKKPQDGPSGMPPAGSPEPHGDTPAS